MSKDLTTSAVARSNVLNNRYALSKLEEHLALGGLRIEGEVAFFKSHVAELLDVDERTIDRYLASHEAELKQNGYQVIKGKSLKNMKLAKVDDISVVDLIGAKVPALGVFTFRAVLNLAMLVTESERAKAIRSRMLDIVLDVVAGGVLRGAGSSRPGGRSHAFCRVHVGGVAPGPAGSGSDRSSERSSKRSSSSLIAGAVAWGGAQVQ